MSAVPGRPQAAGWRRRVEAVGVGLRKALLGLRNSVVYTGGVVRLFLAVGQRGPGHAAGRTGFVRRRWCSRRFG